MHSCTMNKTVYTLQPVVPTLLCQPVGSTVVLGRLPKPEPKPRFFGKTELKQNCGFRRPNGRFGFGGSAYMVLVTVRVFVTGL